MSEALKALENASRRELQALAKELQLCRGNAKSDVIVSNAAEFLDKHPKDGEQMVLAALGSSGNVTPVASPVAKKITPKKDTSKKQEKAVADVDVNIKETQINKQQLRNEPRKVGMKNHEKKTPTKKVTLAVTTKATPTIASQAKSSRVKASSSTKKSPTRESHPASAENNVIAAKEGGPVIDKKPALASRKAELKARKTVEALVKSAKDLTFVGDSRVRCSTTGHEMKADVDVITTYIHGKRYLKARNLKLSFAKYVPMFVDHPNESKPGMLWCNVTELAIARDEKSVKKHISAPKYQKQLPIWKAEEAAKKEAEEEEAQRRAARIEAAKKRRLEAAKEDGDNAAEKERPAKRKRTAPPSDHK